MRFKAEATELDASQWATAQQVLKTNYEFPAGASRVCLTLVYGEEERHVELPLASFSGLLVALGLAPAVEAVKLAMAALTPDALPDSARRPILPTPGQVHDLTASDAAALAREMNAG